MCNISRGVNDTPQLLQECLGTEKRKALTPSATDGVRTDLHGCTMNACWNPPNIKRSGGFAAAKPKGACQVQLDGLEAPLDQRLMSVVSPPRPVARGLTCCIQDQHPTKLLTGLLEDVRREIREGLREPEHLADLVRILRGSEKWPKVPEWWFVMKAFRRWYPKSSW